jgi:phosphate/sulfate permease
VKHRRDGISAGGTARAAGRHATNACQVVVIHHPPVGQREESRVVAFRGASSSNNRLNRQRNVILLRQGHRDRLRAVAVPDRRLRLLRLVAAGYESGHQKGGALSVAKDRFGAAIVDSRPAYPDCTGVSFAHGPNDGQKGMGLIMLILIGTVPTAYALNRALPASAIVEFQQSSVAAENVIAAKAAGHNVTGDPRPAVTAYISQHQVNEETYPALIALMRDISKQVSDAGSVTDIPAAAVGNIRNDMYLTSEAIRFLAKDKESDLSTDDMSKLNAYMGSIDKSTKFIPYCVKIAVAIALGLGTMIGWKRIVVTVGEKIGKTHLTYGQGAAAELVAAATIFAADNYGLPVSTTHVLSSGVAGTMAANGSGLQWSTLRNIALAWVLTLPAAMLLSGALYFIFSRLF